MKKGKVKGRAETDSRFFCLKTSLECPLDFLGHPDCDNCQWYGDCTYCARALTRICESCDHRKTYEEEK